MPSARPFAHRLHRLASAPVLHLEKWYLDSVAPAGAGLIGYAARLRVGPVSMRCSEALSWPADGAPARTRTVFGGGLPVLTAGGITWRSAAIRIDGDWRRLGPAIGPIVLHTEAAGRVEWTGLCPAAETLVTVDGETRTGAGYAERLVMTLAPRRLPIRELRWGRFVSGAHSCVWIRWRGVSDQSWCFHNGRPVNAAMPDLHRLTWDRHRLTLEAGRTIRSGRIAATAFKSAGPLRWLLPRSVGRLVETKWCSRGVLTDDLGCDHAGWAIHEVVLFP